MFHLRSSTSSNTLKSGSHGPSLFEVRLKSPYKNILIIKGTEYEAPSVYVTGNLVFALPEKTTLKRIGLRLIGTFKLDFMEVLTHNNRISSSNPVKELTTVLECDWNNLLVNSEGIIKIGDYGGDSTNNNNNNNSLLTAAGTEASHGGISGSGKNNGAFSARSKLRRPGAPTTLELPESSINKTPFQDMKTPTEGNNFVLPLGNYELPFTCVLPGNIPETIEGLQSGSIFYKFEAMLETSSSSSTSSALMLKSNNSNKIIRHKYIRIFRTLAPDNIALNEEMSISNTWPGRVQYEVSIPRKAVPIGGTIPVKILVVPLKKKLKLGKISASIIQHYVLQDSHNEFYDHDQLIYDSTLPHIPMSQLGTDRWCIQASIIVPSDLKKVTQDCELRNGLIKVRHKLKFKIQLKNEEDGHISELRAKLPFIIYVNPHHKILARNIELDQTGKVHIKPGGVTIFDRIGTSGVSTPTSRFQSPSLDPLHMDDDIDQEEIEREEEDAENLAPPLYEKHIYDQLYDALTGITSPPTSPRPIVPRNIAISPSLDAAPQTLVEPSSYFDISPGSSTPTHDLLNQLLSHQGTVPRNQTGVWSPSVVEDELVTSSNIHSRAQSPALERQMSKLDLSVLSRIPSYDEALNGDDGDELTDLAPMYEDSSSNSENVDDEDVESLKPPHRPAMVKAHSSSLVPSTRNHSKMNLNSSSSSSMSTASTSMALPTPTKTHSSSRKMPTGSQSYFDVTRNNSSSDLKQLGMTRPASVTNFSDLLHRRLLKKGISQSALRGDK